MTTVLFACVRNAGRSQLAAALFNQLAPEGHRAISAGTDPADQVHPEVVAALAEVGIDLVGTLPRRLTYELAEGVDLLVTMGCGDQCPAVPVARRDWPLPDPAGQPPDAVREIREDIRGRVEALLAELTAR